MGLLENIANQLLYYW